MSSKNYVPFGAATFVFDQDSTLPTVIEFRLPSIKFALVNRYQKLITDEWQKPGFYFLLGPGSVSMNYRIYVGKAPSGVANRVSQQVTDRDWWDRALIVIADRHSGFSSAEVSWFESKFISLLKNNLAGDLQNKSNPTDNSLPSYHIKELESYIPSIEAVLNLLGVLSYNNEPEIDNEPDIDKENDQNIDHGNSYQISWKDASIEALKRKGKPMHFKDIARDIIENKIRDIGKAKTPEATIRRDLRMSILNGESVFIQTAPSTFGLNLGV